MKRRFVLPFVAMSFIIVSGFTMLAPSSKDERVPPELGMEPVTILFVETEIDKVNSEVTDDFGEYYNGKVETIKSADTAAQKYADVKKYRYYFTAHEFFTAATGMGANRMPGSIDHSYSLKDRLTGNFYSTGRKSNPWKKLLRSYIKEMEEVRLANEKTK